MNQYRKYFIIIRLCILHLPLLLQNQSPPDPLLQDVKDWALILNELFLPSWCFNFTAKTQMIFYITTTHCLVRYSCSFKFTKDLFIGFAHNIGQYIQPAAMCHSNYHFLHIIICSSINDCIKAGMVVSPPSSENLFCPTYFV